jgi:hypothetical protein
MGIKEKNLQKETARSLKFMTVWSVAAVVSIPCCIIGWVNSSNVWFLIMAILGTAVLGVSFYGLPIGWTISYANKKSNLTIYNMIVDDNLTSVKDIAANANSKPKMVIQNIYWLIRNGYLRNYKLNDERTELVIMEKPKVIKNKCPYCGGQIDIKTNICEYCNTKF